METRDHHRFRPAALGHLAHDADARQGRRRGRHRPHPDAPTPITPAAIYEFEQVKKIKEDASWLPETRGKAFKMVSQLLYELPPSEKYRVIFMERDLDEMLVSQEKMLKRLNRPAAPAGDIKPSFIAHLDRLRDWLAPAAEYRGPVRQLQGPHRAPERGSRADQQLPCRCRRSPGNGPGGRPVPLPQPESGIMSVCSLFRTGCLCFHDSPQVAKARHQADAQA